MLPREAAYERLGQLWNVAAPRAQRRHRERRHGEPMQKTLFELRARIELGNRAARGRGGARGGLLERAPPPVAAVKGARGDRCRSKRSAFASVAAVARVWGRSSGRTGRPGTSGL